MSVNKALEETLEICDHERILIVDDDEEIRDIFQLVLSDGCPECIIETAVNGADAYETFLKKKPAILIMDLHMPVMDGEAAYLEIEETCKEKGWKMPSVIFCTAYNPPQGVQHIVNSSERNDLLKKPVSNDDLVKKVRSKLLR